MPRGAVGTDPPANANANSAGRALLKPRVLTAAVVDVEEHAAQVQHSQELKLAELRRKALAALNVGLPPERVGVAEPTVPSASGRCVCLRRSGRCTCQEDRAWLQSKRKEVTLTPSKAQDSSCCEPETEKGQDSEPLKVGFGYGGSRGTWSLPAGEANAPTNVAPQRKRRLVVPYVPPHVKEREVELKSNKSSTKSSPSKVRKVEPKAAALSPGQASTDEKQSNSPDDLVDADEADVASSGEWDGPPEQRGESRFNPLQMDAQIVLEEEDGLVAECVDHPLSVKGVKGLPTIQSGHYQYEVELLRDTSIMVGWSGAMTLPGVLDFQGYAYSSTGSKVHGKEESAYSKTYGKEGDVVGALIDWIEPETATGTSSIQISFCLNGESLGVAFTVAASLVDAKKPAPVPMQPHICQLPKGDMFKVRLRGSKAELPLKHPVDGYQPLSAVSEEDFCPFKVAVAAATSERVIMNLTPEDLKSFRVPEDHTVELYDFPAETKGEALTSSVACFLGLKRHIGVLHVSITEAGSTTALVACRRPEHAEKLIAATTSDDGWGVATCIDSELKINKPLHFEARPLISATARSKQCLRDWQGEEFKPHQPNRKMSKDQMEI